MIFIEEADFCGRACWEAWLLWRKVNGSLTGENIDDYVTRYRARRECLWCWEPTPRRKG